MIKRSFCVLVNPAARNGQTRKLISKVEKALTALPIHFRIVITTDVTQAQQITSHAIKQGEYIAVMGGDGTTRAIAGIVNQLHGVLAFIPAGRGNDLVRTLNLPLDPIAACKVLAYGTETTIDMGSVNHQPFLGICSLGFDSIANEWVNRARLMTGRAVYLYGGLRTLLGWQPIKFKVNVDGKIFEHVGYTVAVANSPNYGGGMYIAPKASIRDGLLDVVLVGQISKLRMLVNMPRVFKGTHINEPGFAMIRGKRIIIEAEQQFTVYADGDAISQPPAEITIMPNALRVLVPSVN